MDRRLFLKSLFTASVVAIVAPKIYALPPSGGWRNVNGVYRTGKIGDIFDFTFRFRTHNAADLSLPGSGYINFSIFDLEIAR